MSPYKALSHHFYFFFFRGVVGKQGYQCQGVLNDFLVDEFMLINFAHEAVFDLAVNCYLFTTPRILDSAMSESMSKSRQNCHDRFYLISYSLFLVKLVTYIVIM